MASFEYHQASAEDIERVGGAFCEEHGDDSSGTIPDAEYDKLFGHLAGILAKYGSFSERSGSKTDFRGSRYVDQIPLIGIVQNNVSPATSTAAALEAVRTSHRPFAVQFDYHPDYLLIVPPNKVFTTFEKKALAKPQS